jgi:CHAT domain-containing protein
MRMAGSPEDGLAALKQVPIHSVPAGYAHLRARYAWTEALALESIGRLDVARDRFDAAIAVLSRAGEAENLSATSNHAAEMNWDLGDRGEAWRTEIGALALAAGLPVSTRRNVVFLTAGFFALAEDLPEAALAFYDDLVTSLEHASTPIGAPDAYAQRARTFLQLGRRADALHDLQRAEQAVAAIDDPVLGPRAGAGLVVLRAELFEETDPARAAADVTRALEYYGRTASPTRLARLLELRARARRRLNDLDGAAADLQGAVDSFEHDRGRLRAPQDRMQALDIERSAAHDLVEHQFIERHDEAAAFRATERNRAGGLLDAWDLSELSSVDPVQLHTRLTADVAVVYFTVLRDRVVTWILTSTERQVLVWPARAREVAADVGKIRQAVLEGADIAALRRVGGPLIDHLLRPAIDRISPSARIVIVPDETLFGVPFGALPDQSLTPLLATHVVAVAPSLTAFLAASARLRGFSASDVLAIGDGHDPASSRLPRIAAADAEARQVASLYPKATVLVGQDATRARVTSQQTDVLHFSGHAVINNEYPLFSRLLLAPDGPYGAELLGNDILNMRYRRTGVVVLGSCEGAAGRFIRGEGAVSLAQIFLDAGVPSIVGSLWPVDDRSGPLLVGFHRYLRQDLDPASALAHSERDLLRQVGVGAAVEIWGGFQAVGGVR